MNNTPDRTPYKKLKENFQRYIEEEEYALLDSPEQRKKKVNIKLNDPFEDEGKPGDIELDEFNTSHNKDGEFSSKKDSTCDSSYFVDGTRKRKSGSLSDKDDSGRGKTKTKGKGRYICKNNEPLYEDAEVLAGNITKNKLNELIRTELIELLNQYEVQLKEQDSPEAELYKKCKSLNLMSFKDFLTSMNNLNKAAKGDLFSN